MSKETTSERQVMIADTPPISSISKPKKGLPQPPLSLTKAAKAVGVSTSTLRRAIEDGKLKAVKSEEGHWRIKVDQLMQYKSNELDSPATASAAQGVAAPVAQPATAPATEAADRRAGTVSRDMHDTVVDIYEARLKDREKEISRLESTAENYRTDYKELQKKYDTHQLVLTDQREENFALKATIEERQKIRWSYVASVAFIGVLLVAGYLYRDDIGNRLTQVVALSE